MADTKLDETFWDTYWQAIEPIYQSFVEKLKERNPNLWSLASRTKQTNGPLVFAGHLALHHVHDMNAEHFDITISSEVKQTDSGYKVSIDILNEAQILAETTPIVIQSTTSEADGNKILATVSSLKILIEQNTEAIAKIVA